MEPELFEAYAKQAMEDMALAMTMMPNGPLFSAGIEVCRTYATAAFDAIRQSPILQSSRDMDTAPDKIVHCKARG